MTTNTKIGQNRSKEHVKIFFDLEQVDDFPPVAVESLWAVRVMQDSYKIDNIPFYVNGIALDDVICAKISPTGELKFDSVVTESGHSTFRVVFFDPNSRERLCREIEDLGCAWEGGYEPSLIAIDVPPSVDLSLVLRILSEGFEKDLFDYQEGKCVNS